MYVALGGPKGYETVTVRECTLIPGTNKKKTHIIKSYGRLSEREKENPNFLVELKEEVKLQTKALKEQGKPISISCPTNVALTKPNEGVPVLHYGHTIIKKLWSILKLDSFFDEKCTQKNAELVKEGLFSLVTSRLTNPSSIRKAHKNQVKLAGLTEVTLDLMYSLLDIFVENKEDLVCHLSKFFEKNTNRRTDTVCYDVTNYYFESTDKGQLRLFGFSKEHKNNEVIVVMGLLIDCNGIPITYRLFPGNTMDQNTLQDSVDELKQLYGFKEITVIADRGMNSKDNLVFLSNEGHHFVISYTLKKAGKEFQDLCINDDMEWDTELFSSLTGERTYAARVVETTYKAKILLTQEELDREKELKEQNGTRGRIKKYKTVDLKAYVHVTYSLKRALKDAQDRERALEKLQKRIDNNTINASIHHGVNQYLTINVDTNSAKVDIEKVKDAAKWDGFYAVVTDRKDLTTEDVSKIYKTQWKIEESFRILKTDLEARPVRVYKDSHVEGHFALCFLCLSIIRYLQYYLQTQKVEAMSAERIMDAMSKPTISVLGEWPEVVLATTDDITEDYIKISKALKIPYMEKFMTLTRFRAITKLNILGKVKDLVG